MNATPPLTDEQELQLARYRAGAMSSPERAAFEQALLASDALAEALYAEQSLDRASRGEPGVAAPSSRARRRALWAPIAAAAAVLLAVFVTLQPWQLRPGTGELRSGSAAPQLRVSEDGEWLTWTAVPEAEVYRVIVLDEAGIEQASEVVSALRLRLDDIAPDALERGQWRVVPQTADGVDLPGSAPQGFTRRR